LNAARSQLPFVSLPDPKVSGEGALDPLGLATIGDGLADWVLPGFTARMSRPRFATAIAVSAVVCDGMEDRFAADGETETHLVFEWLVVEGFARAAERSTVRGTPGIEKATRARAAGTPLGAKAYLKAPIVFGFHGVYRRIAEHLGLVDGELLLRDNGYELVRTWEREQGLHGFLESAAGDGPGTAVRALWRAAVRDGLQAGYTARGGGWQGFPQLARHLAPSQVGRREAALLTHLFRTTDQEGATGEIYGLLAEKSIADSDLTEAVVARSLLARVSADLAQRLRAIDAYEQVCVLLEWCFERLRFLSSTRRTQTLPARDFAADTGIAQLVSQLPQRVDDADRFIVHAPFKVQRLFTELAKRFGGIASPETLFEALLARHAEVQKAKPPEGKREWFERAADGSIFVRPPYRVDTPHELNTEWNRPYRLNAVRSFCRDLSAVG
jgi:hypothetical protein